MALESTATLAGDNEVLIRVQDLVTAYRTKSTGRGSSRRSHITVVDGVSFDLKAGKTLGIVGESGCGKSSVANSLMRLVDGTSGSVMFEGRDVLVASGRRLRNLRRHIQMVFQDPFTSLNPRMRIADFVAEPLVVQLKVSAKKARAQALEMLERVGISGANALKFPHQLSGGQRQRVGIARAVILRPRVLILDEPVSALDVSVQAQVINLLQDLQAELGFAALFISHDLSVVRHVSDEVGVMYLGRIVEMGTNDQIFGQSAHPYTRALLSAVPETEPENRAEDRIVLTGDVPSPANPPSGCRFRTRCWKAQAICAEVDPELVGTPSSGHAVACLFPEVTEVSSVRS